jgi:type VI secretion system protein ImpK
MDSPLTATSVPGVSGRTENLALIFQEMLTATVRLRSDRQQVSNADVFRAQVMNAIKVADQQARARGYTEEDIRLATFAVVAFLDESVLNLRKPIFKDWVRRPLQEELFGRHVAGEIFFDYANQILGRRDAPETADLLEVYQLCLLLGYQGKYSISSRGDLRALMGQIEDKMQRIRKSTATLSPGWPVADDGSAVARVDPWLRRLAILFAVIAVLTVVLFGVYELSLASGARTLEEIAAPGGGR